MSKDWEKLLVERLCNHAHRDGGWSYSPSGTVCAEATSLACMALTVRSTRTDVVEEGLALLAGMQHRDGSIPVVRNMEAPAWTTGLAILAWCSAAAEFSFDAQKESAVAWLLRTRSKTIDPNPSVYGHDTMLTGWSWVADTHAWVEPTAYAVLALRAAGKAAHPRAGEGARLILDRAIPTGGWNYGNPRVYRNTLRPFPGPTGVALAALTDQTADSRIETGITYLRNELERVRSPMSLGWGLIGLSAWGRRPPDAPAWLEESAIRSLRRPPNALFDSLLLLAAVEPCPIPAPPLEAATSHG